MSGDKNTLESRNKCSYNLYDFINGIKYIIYENGFPDGSYIQECSYFRGLIHKNYKNNSKLNTYSNS